MKLLTVNNKEENLKSYWGEKRHYSQRTKDRDDRFLVRRNTNEKMVEQYFKSLKQKIQTCQSVILCPVKISFKNEDKNRDIQTYKCWKSSSPGEEMLEEVIQVEWRYGSIQRNEEPWER